ncbi:uncharacterized protein LOC132270596 [Cornus florida]|uniref:uncharacterized protein LOC132270596 n=1 Tax=Cornus florida TaxID=4283 RepID=UPI00289BA6DA|nr:uncharacterized protein LOC132270596 [Cornus florida]
MPRYSRLSVAHESVFDIDFFSRFVLTRAAYDDIDQKDLADVHMSALPISRLLIRLYGGLLMQIWPLHLQEGAAAAAEQAADDVPVDLVAMNMDIDLKQPADDPEHHSQVGSPVVTTLNIMQGQFGLFQIMYKPYLEEHATNDLLRFSSSGGHQVNISQDSSLSTVSSLVSILPAMVRGQMRIRVGEEKKVGKSGQVIREVVINSREEVTECMQKVVRRRVMISSARQAVSGILTVGAVHGVRYLANKMRKAWKSWT